MVRGAGTAPGCFLISQNAQLADCQIPWVQPCLVQTASRPAWLLRSCSWAADPWAWHQSATRTGRYLLFSTDSALLCAVAGNAVHRISLRIYCHHAETCLALPLYPLEHTGRPPTTVESGLCPVIVLFSLVSGCDKNNRCEMGIS